MLESLEIRQVLSAVVGPTADQQYALELINLVRTNPSAAATKFTSGLSADVQATLSQYGLTAGGLQSELGSATSQPPLAWSDALGSSAQSQSQYEASNGTQTHQGPGESGLLARITSAGYSNISTYGENTYAYAESTDEAMQSFLFDWGVSDHGHYNNLMQPGTSAEGSYKDVGIGLVDTSNQGLGPVVVTMDFGSQSNEAPQILGVVYQDSAKTGFYAPGEGRGGVTIDAVNLSTGQDYQVQSMSAGGYQIPVAANASYQVTATEDGRVISSQQVHVGDVNAMADFIDNPSTAPAQPTAPTPTPTPAPRPVALEFNVSVATNVASPQAPQAATPQPTAQQPQSSSQSQATAPPQAQDQTSTPTTPSWLSSWSRWSA